MRILPLEVLSRAQEAVLGPWGRSLAAETSDVGVARAASDLVRAATGDGWRAGASGVCAGVFESGPSAGNYGSVVSWAPRGELSGM